MPEHLIPLVVQTFMPKCESCGSVLTPRIGRLGPVPSINPTDRPLMRAACPPRRPSSGAAAAPNIEAAPTCDPNSAAASTAPTARDFRALALFGRRPLQRVVSLIIPATKTCTIPDSCAAANSPFYSITSSARRRTAGGTSRRGPWRFEVEHRLELHRRLHGQISRLFAFENAVHIAGSLAVGAADCRPVGARSSGW